MFNTAYQVGGPVCAVKTVEKLTGLRMDHYVEVDFTGFKNLVDALDGVPITTTEADPRPPEPPHPPGRPHTLDGEQALGLVRTRHGVADGSDLGRIQLQQAFVKALLDRIGGLGLLSSPAKLISVADTATRRHHRHRPGLGEQADGSGRQRAAPELPQCAHGDAAGPAGDRRPQPGAADRLGGRDGVGRARADKPIPAAATKGSVADRPDAGQVVGASPEPPLPDPSAPSDPLTCENIASWQDRRYRELSGPAPWFWEMRPVLADWSAGPGSRDANPRCDPAPSRT